MTTISLDYDAHLVWDGNTGRGTANYAAYERTYHLDFDGKTALHGSANARFRGDPSRHDPEDLFLAALASCHMLAYLALCARAGVTIVAYEDRARGTLTLDAGGGGRFTDVVLLPVVTVDREEHVARATTLHDEAHARCFIASSCSVPVRHEPAVRVAAVAS